MSPFYALIYSFLIIDYGQWLMVRWIVFVIFIVIPNKSASLGLTGLKILFIGSLGCASLNINVQPQRSGLAGW